MIEVLFLLISLLMIFICGLFVAAEFSLIAVDRTKVERLEAKGDKAARGVNQALSTLSTQLSSAQVGITITNLIIGFLAEPSISKLLREPLEAIGLEGDFVTVISLILGIAIATALTMIFGELVPKNIAIAKPLATAKSVQKPIRLFSHYMKYPIAGLNGSANFILRKLGVEPQEELASARSADELLSLVRRSAEKGTLPKETAEMLERSLNFGDLTALDVMTPRVRVEAVPLNMTVSEILQVAKSSGHSRFPVYSDNLDNIRGVVHIKHLLGVPRNNRETIVAASVMVKPVLVPSNIELEPLLQSLRKGGLQMAIVIDEFGGTDGIVTMEDLLEELVGEVHDEHDRLKVAIRKRKDGSWILSGLLRPDEIGEELDIFLPEDEDSETIAGLVAHYLKRLPKAGDKVSIAAVDRDGQEKTVKLKVERMDANRVDRIRMVVIGKQEGEAQS